MGMKHTFSSFRITVWCTEESVDFGIHWARTRNLDSVFYEWADSGKGRQGSGRTEGLETLAHLKGAASESPQEGLEGAVWCAQVCWFSRKVRHLDFYGKFPSFTMLATNSIIRYSPMCC